VKFGVLSFSWRPNSSEIFTDNAVMMVRLTMMKVAVVFPQSLRILVRKLTRQCVETAHAFDGDQEHLIGW
jgi:hypothetical protein